MKIDYIYLLLAIIVAGLLAWGTYEISKEELNVYAAVVTFVTMSITGAGILAVKIEGRGSVSIKATSCAAFVILLVSNYAFSFFDYSIPLYVILNAIILVLYLIVCRMVFNSDV